MTDRFGLGWRPELALDLLRHGDQVEVLEFIAEDWLDAPTPRLATLAAWCRERPCHLHGTSLGLASTAPISPSRLTRWRQLIAAVQPTCWSEHLAFVRAGGIELGHLAAPPRTADTCAGTLANLALIKQMVGSLPHLENVATLMTPLGSDLDEPEWLSRIIEGSGAGMLLDLHNLYANAMNQGWDPVAALDSLPLSQVAAVHLAGGRLWRGRVLDDHLHPVPEAVFGLLEELAARTSQAIDVIIERDGGFPPFGELLDELAEARARVAAGRARRHRDTHQGISSALIKSAPRSQDPGAQAREIFLARLYTEPGMREQFLADPSATTLDIPAEWRDAISTLDREGLKMVAESLHAKRRSVAQGV